MDKLETAIVHINVSIQDKIDKKAICSCIKGVLFDQTWSYHVKTFFLETPISLMHDIVLSGFFTFEDGTLKDIQTMTQQNGSKKCTISHWVELMNLASNVLSDLPEEMPWALGGGTALFLHLRIPGY